MNEDTTNPTPPPAQEKADKEAKYWRERSGKLERKLLELADHFGLGLFYECNKPGVMGWWWEYGEGTQERLSMQGDYIHDLPETIDNYFMAVGFRGQYYEPEE